MSSVSSTGLLEYVQVVEKSVRGEPHPKTTMDMRVQQTALNALSYLGSALFLNTSAAICFATTPICLGLLNIALGSFLLDLTLQVAVYLMERQGWLARSHRFDKGLASEFVDRCRQWSILSMTTCLSLAGPGILIHELGHAAAALLCFENARISISIDPFRGGSTHVVKTDRLTGIGSLLGWRHASLFLAVAGIVATTAFALWEFNYAHNLQQSHPQAAEWIQSHGIALIANDFIYGLTSWTDPGEMAGSDFIKAWHLGAHPALLLVIMVALPLIQRLFMNIPVPPQKHPIELN